MRILSICILVLICGTLGSTTEEEEEEQAKPRQRLPHHLYILGYLNTTLEDIEKFDIEMCEKNGGPNSYAEHKRSREQYDNCENAVYLDIRDEIQIEVESSPFNTNDIFYHVYCRRAAGIANCLKNFTISMKPCLDPSKHESADVLYNIVTAVTNFGCENDGARIGQVITSGGNECLETRSNELENCANQTVVKYVQNTISNGASIGGVGKYHLLVPDRDKCTVLDKLHRCIIDVLSSCKEPMPELGNSLFKLLKKVTTCDRYLKSNASSSGIVNLLLITVAMATSMRFAKK